MANNNIEIDQIFNLLEDIDQDDQPVVIKDKSSEDKSSSVVERRTCHDINLENLKQHYKVMYDINDIRPITGLNISNKDFNSIILCPIVKLDNNYYMTLYTHKDRKVLPQRLLSKCNRSSSTPRSFILYNLIVKYMNLNKVNKIVKILRYNTNIYIVIFEDEIKFRPGYTRLGLNKPITDNVPLYVQQIHDFLATNKNLLQQIKPPTIMQPENYTIVVKIYTTQTENGNKRKQLDSKGNDQKRAKTDEPDIKIFKMENYDNITISQTFNNNKIAAITVWDNATVRYEMKLSQFTTHDSMVIKLILNYWLMNNIKGIIFLSKLN